MTDYKEEQHNELEALESIYPEEFSIISNEDPICFKMCIKAFNEKTEDFPEIVAKVDIQFTYVENYPDAIPLIEVSSNEILTDENVQELEELMLKEAEENLGMVMVFTLVSSAQEKLQEFVDNIKKGMEEEKRRREKEEEEREKKKFTGTPVTKENFLEWREKFNAEMSEMKKKTRNVLLIPKSKITGRELFEQDEKMILSDAAFIDSTDVDVEVDESLFQDIDDLELDDEEFKD
ncbi:RWD domain-containing protein 1-like [Actinia tenebrosa]|uniref:RWD domain-containing protein 1-like n=1 Tax=Actinia tenebrosa TaxID=6105 RepID=A0A6P8HW81_ACTTE|nr:RWD domain-containing protein 1-like [Actinia tenebrosa]XP_031559627.1 RWD domain-containing protein 1-like [Actinia tenebrosa]